MGKTKRQTLKVTHDPHGKNTGRIVSREHLARAIADDETALNGVDMCDVKTGENYRVYHEEIYRVDQNGKMTNTKWWG